MNQYSHLQNMLYYGQKLNALNNYCTLDPIFLTCTTLINGLINILVDYIDVLTVNVNQIHKIQNIGLLINLMS